MPHKLLYLAILIIACFEISAQKVVFDLNARVSMAQAGLYTKLDSFNSYSTTRLDDTTVIRSYMNYVYEDKTDYLANIVYPSPCTSCARVVRRGCFFAACTYASPLPDSP